MVLAPRDRQLAFAETHVVCADAVDAQHLDARAVTAENLDVGLCNPKRLGQQLLERLVGGTVYGWCGERDLEGAVLNPDDPVAAGTRSHADLEGDRAVLLSNP